MRDRPKSAVNCELLDLRPALLEVGARGGSLGSREPCVMPTRRVAGRGKRATTEALPNVLMCSSLIKRHNDLRIKPLFIS